MIRRVVMLDWDGVCVDTMPFLVSLAIKCIKNNLNINLTKELLLQKMIYLSGIPFHEAIKQVFPSAEPVGLEACAREFRKEMTQMGPGIETFPGVPGIIRVLTYNNLVVISSAAPISLIRSWLKKEGLLSYISTVFGEEDGPKDKHVERMRGLFPRRKIVFISDSVRDMRFGDGAIGVSPVGREREFFVAGAKRAVHSLHELSQEDIEAVC